jgi:1,4-alpha-glucan branching enzyme
VRYPRRLRIAEDMQGNAWLVKSVPEGGAGFGAQWDASFVHALREAVIGAYDEARDMEVVAAAIGGGEPSQAWQRVIFTESHDEVANGKARVPEEIAPGSAGDSFARKRAMLGAGLVFTAPGIPMIFQGQEFSLGGWFDDSLPLPWQKAEEEKDTIRYYRDLIGLRRNLGGTSGGLRGSHVDVYHVDNEAKLIAFHRWAEGGAGDDVIVVANFANEAVSDTRLGFPRAGAWRVRLDSNWRKYGTGDGKNRAPDVPAALVDQEATGGGMPYAGNVTLAPYALLILSQPRGD